MRKKKSRKVGRWENRVLHSWELCPCSRPRRGRMRAQHEGARGSGGRKNQRRGSERCRKQGSFSQAIGLELTSEIPSFQSSLSRTLNKTEVGSHSLSLTGCVPFGWLFFPHHHLIYHNLPTTSHMEIFHPF